MKTKEDYINILAGPVPLNEKYKRSTIERCLDGWGEEQAIAFADYIAFRHTPHDIGTWDKGKRNTTEIYHDFLQSQSTNNKEETI